jgi:CDP-diglyceride synthetase
MKRARYLIIGAVGGLICGTILAMPFNYWYATNFIRSDDDSNFLVSILLFGFWPIFTLVGGIIGHLLHRKYLALRTTKSAEKRRTDEQLR